MRKGLLLFLLCIALVIVDQGLKAWFLGHVADWGFVRFQVVTNPGSSFGLLQNFGPYLMWLSVIALGLILFFFGRLSSAMRVPMTLVAAGVTGNLIDRMRFGYVIDFVDLRWWPVFNVADACISIGVVWLVLLDLTRMRGGRQAHDKAS